MICKQKQPRGWLRGFTLLEMVVVMAIIGILVAVLVPSMSGYITRSRLNSANANAKVLFNDIQTLCQEMEFSERSAESSTFYGTYKIGAAFDDGGSAATYSGSVYLRSPSQSGIGSLTYGQITGVNVVVKKVSGGSETEEVNSSTPSGAAAVAAQTALNMSDASDVGAFQNRLLRLFDETGSVSWAAYIVNYQVKAVICADTEDNKYLGAYPAKTTERDEFGITMRAMSKDVILDYAKGQWKDTSNFY